MLKVANILKAGNREIFKRDLEIRLADVKLTHDTITQQVFFIVLVCIFTSNKAEYYEQPNDDFILPTVIISCKLY
jgi:hypothetical protein